MPKQVRRVVSVAKAAYHPQTGCGVSLTLDCGHKLWIGIEPSKLDAYRAPDYAECLTSPCYRPKTPMGNDFNGAA